MDHTLKEDNIKIAKFNGRNFNTWKYSVYIKLRDHDLVPIVEGTKPKPQVVIIKRNNIRKKIIIYNADRCLHR